jgi:hypothetical protein
LGALEAFGDQTYIVLRGLDACLRFLLKGMQDIHHIGKTHGTDRAECIAPMIFNDLVSDLKEIGCKIGGTGHISSLFWAIE